MSDASDGERLAKLVRMLSSDNDGEVVNTVRAIDRWLRTRGLDWHHLADKLAAIPLVPEELEPAQPEEPEPEHKPRKQKKPKVYRGPPDWPIVSPEEVELLTAAFEARVVLKSKEQDFIAEMYMRVSRYPGTARWSEKQRKWALDLFEKTRARGGEWADVEGDDAGQPEPPF